jgi:anthranilate synthase component 1
MYYPDFEDFVKKAQEGNLIPVYREILADLETPVSAFMKIDGGEYSFLLESVIGGEKWARYCFLGSNPTIIFQSKGNEVKIIKDGQREEVIKLEKDSDPLHYLKEIMSQYKPVPVQGLPRFYGGAVGYLGYDMVRFFERLPDQTQDDLCIPDSVFMLTDSLLIFDHMAQKIKVVHNVHLADQSPEEGYAEAIERIDGIISQLVKPLPESTIRAKGLGQKSLPISSIDSTFDQKDFQEAVVKAKEYVKSGDIIQVVLAQRLKFPVKVSPFNIYRALRTINPSPYMFYLQLDNLKLIGSSPEILVRQEGSLTELRPIAGTRPRGKTEEEDGQLAQDLLRDPKERAEHIMLVDLGRNDVGRIAKTGTVKVDQLMVIEKYSHVMHIVSNVRGEKRDDKDCYDVIRACFPAGTVSGAPKIRAMEIIEELEPTKRGPYAGAVGYFSFSGNMDTCITIRTLVIKEGIGYLGVGAGIVMDSEPANEYAETMNKAKALLLAVEKAAEIGG